MMILWGSNFFFLLLNDIYVSVKGWMKFMKSLCKHFDLLSLNRDEYYIQKSIFQVLNSGNCATLRVEEKGRWLIIFSEI